MKQISPSSNYVHVPSVPSRSSAEEEDIEWKVPLCFVLSNTSDTTKFAKQTQVDTMHKLELMTMRLTDPTAGIAAGTTLFLRIEGVTPDLNQRTYYADNIAQNGLKLEDIPFALGSEFPFGSSLVIGAWKNKEGRIPNGITISIRDVNGAVVRLSGFIYLQASCLRYQ